MTQNTASDMDRNFSYYIYDEHLIIRGNVIWCIAVVCHVVYHVVTLAFMQEGFI